MGKYKDELKKIAAAVGEEDDPFAAWESLHTEADFATLADALDVRGYKLDRSHIQDIVNEVNSKTSLVAKLG